jgi:hypothetical protein
LHYIQIHSHAVHTQYQTIWIKENEKVLKVIQIHAFRVKASSNIKGYAYAI